MLKPTKPYIEKTINHWWRKNLMRGFLQKVLDQGFKKGIISFCLLFMILIPACQAVLLICKQQLNHVPGDMWDFMFVFLFIWKITWIISQVTFHIYSSEILFGRWLLDFILTMWYGASDETDVLIILIVMIKVSVANCNNIHPFLSY